MRFVIYLVAVLLLAEPLTKSAIVPREHPRLLGNAAELKEIAKERRPEFERMRAVATSKSGDDHSRGISMALVAAIDDNIAMAHEAQELAMKLVNGPIRKGHVTFGHDLALAGLIYDLCHSAWSEGDRSKFHEYFIKTVEANRDSETHVFHNGWYAYKNWGIGIAALASYHENPWATEILAELDKDYRTRAAPALELAGAGGGWAEGYYIHYWSYEWLFFCEVLRRSGGVDYFELAPAFYKNRALASAFETYPGLSEYNTRRPIPMGDGGGRVFGGDRDKQLSARRILVNWFRDDPTHQALHTFNELTPRVGVGNNAYKDFLWRNATVVKGNLKFLPLSHFAAGPGFVYARSSWGEDATYFFLKAGDRFTAHQHLDNGHFLIYREGELAGDGGHYESFGGSHDVNYHARSIAHNTVLILDPRERWPAIRGGKVTGNDGGQHHNWPHHNGAVGDPGEWEQKRHLYDIADMLAFRERGQYMYAAVDLTRSYSSNKLVNYTRQVVYLRPGTFVILDNVTSARREFKKTWVLQAMKPPTRSGDHHVISNGKGKLYVQTLLPERPVISFASGSELYGYGGKAYPPERSTGAAPECRVEISPAEESVQDFFLHVLTATDAGAEAAPLATLQRNGDRLEVKVGEATIAFSSRRPGGEIQIGAQREELEVKKR